MIRNKYQQSSQQPPFPTKSTFSTSEQDPNIQIACHWTSLRQEESEEVL
jgi:hypothetical protein